MVMQKFLPHTAQILIVVMITSKVATKLHLKPFDNHLPILEFLAMRHLAQLETHQDLVATCVS